VSSPVPPTDSIETPSLRPSNLPTCTPSLETRCNPKESIETPSNAPTEVPSPTPAKSVSGLRDTRSKAPSEVPTPAPNEAQGGNPQSTPSARLSQTPVEVFRAPSEVPTQAPIAGPTQAPLEVPKGIYDPSPAPTKELIQARFEVRSGNPHSRSSIEIPSMAPHVGPTDKSPVAFRSAHTQVLRRPPAGAHSQRLSPVLVSPLWALALSWTPTKVPSHEPSVAPSQTPDQVPRHVPSAVPSLAAEASARVKLRELIDKSSQAYRTSPSWADFVRTCRDPRGDLHADVGHLPHRAAHVLDQLRRHGSTVGMKTPPWNLEQKRQALKRCSHQSSKQHSGFLCEEFVDLMRKNQWALLPADLVLHEPNLRLTPLGVVPQRDRRPRTICDYYLFLINLETIPLAPSEAMQFGRALWRVLSTIHHAGPRFGPVYLSKIDIADGFYRIGVNDVDVAKLGVVVPTEPGEPKVIGFPLVLPMGWIQSPPLFTAATETVADLANQALQHSTQSCPHRLDVLSESVAPPSIGALPALTSPSADPVPHRRAPQGHPHPAVKKWDVYIVDFIGMVQGGWHHSRHLKRVLLHTLDLVFCPLDSGDSEHRQEPASVKKMRKGDATWSTRKVILGWILDSCQLTLELPCHRIARLFELLDSVVPSQHRVSTKK
jgi:hypothetical protein